MNITIGSDGVIAIIGKLPYQVTIQVTGFQPINSIAHLVNQFGRNCIETTCVKTKKPIILFTYNLRGELRNPDRLLKKLRGKLMQASLRAHTQFEDEYYRDYESYPSQH